MNDEEETVALIAGGHTFGKAHGAHKPEKCVGADAGGAAIEEQGRGWKNKCGKGHSEDTVTSGLEGAWTSQPAKWTHMYLTNLYSFEWKQTKSPTGAIQFVPTDDSIKTVPDAHVPKSFTRQSCSPLTLRCAMMRHMAKSRSDGSTTPKNLKMRLHARGLSSPIGIWDLEPGISAAMYLKKYLHGKMRSLPLIIHSSMPSRLNLSKNKS